MSELNYDSVTDSDVLDDTDSDKFDTIELNFSYEKQISDTEQQLDLQNEPKPGRSENDLSIIDTETDRYATSLLQRDTIVQTQNYGDAQDKHILNDLKYDHTESATHTNKIENCNYSHLQQTSTDLNKECLNEVFDGDLKEIMQKQPSSHETNLKSDVEEFLTELGLKDLYPEKINLTDVIQIQTKTELSNLTDIPWIVLQNLMMINSTSRDKMVEEALDKITPEKKSDTDNEDIFRELGFCESETTLNPMDLMISIFMCSSPALKGILASKLFTCKLAIPFVIPVEGKLMMFFSLLHNILLDDKTEEQSVILRLAADIPCHIISFFRLGNPNFSKSALMNYILSETGHQTFFNRNCSLGTTLRSISNGLIEIAWYIPSGTSNNVFEKTTMFLNLRGDCQKLQFQLKFLSEISSVVVVFIELSKLTDTGCIQTLQNLNNSVQCGTVLAIDAFDSDKKLIGNLCKQYYEKIPEHKHRLKMCPVATNRKVDSNSEIKKRMVYQISELLKGSVIKSMSTKIGQTDVFQFISRDEDDSRLKQAIDNARDLCSQIPTDPVVIDIIAPLQRKPWNTWSNLLKTINKPSNFASLQDRGKLEMEMKDHRLKQFNMFRNIHPFMKTCIVLLIKFMQDDFNLSLLVEWIKLLLDDRARTLSTRAFTKYQSDLTKFKSAKLENSGQYDLEDLEKNANNSKEVFTNVPFGLEHIMRELGQIYEGCMATKSKMTEAENTMVTKLPQIASNLLLIGHPLEIMDGDAENVPITWVKAVLSTLKESVGDKKVLALSVVGVQSSGKSTLLNTMFGLRFAVSAGRCTRGVFMQLIPVQHKKFSFDYVFVIDTEGLRAPDQISSQTFSHDNKLATFVIGLGDIAIVNVKGENTSEVKDILQIAVHAFLRLKIVNQRLNLKQSCVFVHQNVAATDAKDKMMAERQIFVETLDGMAKDAAEQEGITNITTFQQVIDFDPEKNVMYFSDLWQGDPPMAPANPGYSRRVAEVKESIIYKLATKRETYLTITDTIVRIEDLWSGILKDNFVYSFRNTLELKAYSSIERVYHAMTWKLEKHAREFKLSKATTELLKCESEDQLERAVGTVVSTLEKELTNLVESLGKELNLFVEKSTLRDVMVQWQETLLARMKVVSVDLVFKSKTSILQVKEEIRFDQIRASEQTKHEKAINDLARKLAYELKGQKPTEGQMKDRFEDMWVTWLNRFDTKIINDAKSVEVQISELIESKFKSDLIYMHKDSISIHNYENLSRLQFSITESELKSDQICVKLMFNSQESQLQSVDKYKAEALVVANKIFMKIDVRVAELNSQDVGFDISYAKEMFQIIEDSIDEHNEDKSDKYQFNLPSTYRAMLVCHVASYITVVFTRINDRYNKKHSLAGQLEDYKSTVWKLFNNLVDRQTEDVITIGFFKDAVIKAVTDHVSKMIPIDVEERLYELFRQEKYQLMKAIMIDLAHKNDFKEYIAFIKDPACYAKQWITDYGYKHIFDEQVGDANNYWLFAKVRIDKILSLLTSSASKAYKSCTFTKDFPLALWIDEFKNHIADSGQFPLSNEIFAHIYNRNVSDLSSFQEMLNDELVCMKNDAYNKFRNTNKTNVQWHVHPISSLMTKLWGCEEICMFCKEPCLNTDKQHVHFGFSHCCIQHRPGGIGGFRNHITQKLVVEFCNVKIQSETAQYRIAFEEWKLYKEYKKHFPDWDIQPTFDTSKYWMWMMCTYREELKDVYRAELPDIPSSWEEISKEDAINSL